MSKAKILAASEMYIEAWNEYSDGYIDWDRIKDEMTAEKEPCRHTDDVSDLETKAFELKSAIAVLFNKWIECKDEEEPAHFRRYKAAEAAHKAICFRIARINRANSMLMTDADEIEGCYAG